MFATKNLNSGRTLFHPFCLYLPCFSRCLLYSAIVFYYHGYIPYLHIMVTLWHALFPWCRDKPWLCIFPWRKSKNGLHCTHEAEVSGSICTNVRNYYLHKIVLDLILFTKQWVGQIWWKALFSWALSWIFPFIASFVMSCLMIFFEHFTLDSLLNCKHWNFYFK